MNDLENGFELLVQWPRSFRTGGLAGLAPNTATRNAADLVGLDDLIEIVAV